MQNIISINKRKSKIGGLKCYQPLREVEGDRCWKEQPNKASTLVVSND